MQMILRRENLFTRAEGMAPYFGERMSPLGFRLYGLIALRDLKPGSGDDIARRLLDAGLLVEVTEDRLIVAPALTVERHHVDRMAAILAPVLASAG